MSAHGIPTATELLEAIEEMLRSEAIPETEGRLQYNLRVAANALAILQREQTLGAGIDARRAARLDELGFGDLDALLAAIAAGQVDAQLGALIAAEHLSASDRLAVENPRYRQE